MCTLPLEGLVQHSQPTGTLRSFSPLLLLGCSRDRCSITLQILSTCSTTLLRPQPCSVIPEKPLFSPFCCEGFLHSFSADGGKLLHGRTRLHSPFSPPWTLHGRDGRGYSKPNLCAEANIWGGSSLVLANTFKYFRIADNELSR